MNDLASRVYLLLAQPALFKIISQKILLICKRKLQKTVLYFLRLKLYLFSRHSSGFTGSYLKPKVHISLNYSRIVQNFYYLPLATRMIVKFQFYDECFNYQAYLTILLKEHQVFNCPNLFSTRLYKSSTLILIYSLISFRRTQLSLLVR